MIYTSELIEKIMTSPAARRALDYISPIYGNAERFLYILNAIGTQLDDIVGWSDELWNEMFPYIATWSLKYWEQEYGLKTDESMTIEKRRALVVSKIMSRTRMNPTKLKQIVESVAGVTARIDEHTGKNSFSVYLIAPSMENESVLREAIRRVKPTHLIFDILYELSARGELRFAGVVQAGVRHRIRQVN